MLETEQVGVELFADAMGFGETAYIQELFPKGDLGMQSVGRYGEPHLAVYPYQNGEYFGQLPKVKLSVYGASYKCNGTAPDRRPCDAERAGD